MNKKLLVAAIAVATAASASAFAATPLGSATQKGSLLIFPRVESLDATGDFADASSDTLIQITNDSTRAVRLQCYWGTTEGNPFSSEGKLATDKTGTTGGNTAGGKAPNATLAAANRKSIRNNHYMDFAFTLTPNQPVSFWAGDLANTSVFNVLSTNVKAPQFNFFQDATQSNAGELKCWAINSKQAEIHHNHLMGKATVVTFDKTTNANRNQAHEYNAWAFQAHYWEKKQEYPTNSIHYSGKELPTPNVLSLNGKEYDQCPSLLAGQFIPTGHPFSKGFGNGKGSKTQVSIANCHEDMREAGDSHITKLAYFTWNNDENKFSGADDCMGAWREIDLGESFGNFTYKTLKSDTAYFRAEPRANSLCNQGSQKAAMETDIEISSIVGVQVNDIGGVFQTSSNLVGLGSGIASPYEKAAGKGEIMWEPTNGDVGKK
ncbi:hypothetical protein [Crenothrix sp.]|uniref:hypothetical protein n=1 Tax=Crenothrix sp. TaxID=3100433 RepID=UPI00374CFEFE